MKVVALEEGFINNSYKKKGDVFNVEDGLEADWFKPVEDEESGEDDNVL